MISKPRYSKHIFYGKEFEHEMQVFIKQVKKDPKFKNMVKYEDQGVFSLAIRYLIHKYILDRLKVLESQEAVKISQTVVQTPTAN